MLKESDSNELNQWISNIVSIDDKEFNRKLGTGKIVGPPSVRKLEQQFSIQPNQSDVDSIASMLRTNSLNEENLRNAETTQDEEFIHYLIVKIPEKVFIDSLDIYETACEGALVKIEALESEDDWMCLWQCDQPHNVNQQRLFRPTITPTSFKCDTLKLTLQKSLYLIDAIEVKGCKKAVLKRGFSFEQDQTSSYGELSRHMYKLVGSDLFADVYFEVEGKRIAAHRNILSFRSEYFKAMLGSSANFRESNKQNPIYIPNISYDVFLQILTFLYTGHIDIAKLQYCNALDLLRAADLFNMTKLEEVLLYHIGENLNEHNIVIIFREAHEKLPILTKIIDLCYDYMPSMFQKIVESKEFCSLSQDLMIKILNNVVPNIPSAEVKQQQQQQQHSVNRQPNLEDDSDDD